MKKTLTAVALFMLTFTAAAGAAPSINGSTGLIDSPSADTLRDGQFSLGYYRLHEGEVGNFNMNIMKNLEVGVAHFRYDNKADATMLNAKLSLLPETIVSPGLAIGVEDATDKEERSAYAIASKALPFGFRIHAGIGDGRFNGGFAALEKTINPVSIITGNNVFPATTLILEYDGKNTNYGARMAVVPGLRVDAGWRDQHWYLGASYTY